jgi:hypothetical protein
MWACLDMEVKTIFGIFLKSKLCHPTSSLVTIITIVAGTKIVPSRSMTMNAVLSHRNKQHLNLSTESGQLKGKLRLGERTGNNAGRRGAGV